MPLTDRLREARASALVHEPTADVATAVLLEYVAKLRAVAEASQLLLFSSLCRATCRAAS